jgi:hypothetical protein
MKIAEIINSTIQELQGQLQEDAAKAEEYKNRLLRGEGGILALQYLNTKALEAEKAEKQKSEKANKIRSKK